MTAGIGQTLKRQCVEKNYMTETASFSLKTEELSRKIFFQELCLAKCDLLAPRNVIVLVSNFLSLREKAIEKLRVTSTLERWHTNCLVLFAWIDIPKEAFFQPEQFTAMKNAIEDIPPCLKVYLLAGSVLVQPARQEYKRLKQIEEQEAEPDKIIFVNQKNDPQGKSIAEVMALMHTKVPYYYLTRYSSQEPLRKLTKRSLVYFFENEQWKQQSTKLLTARGYRVVESFPKKELSGNCSRKRRVVL